MPRRRSLVFSAGLLGGGLALGGAVVALLAVAAAGRPLLGGPATAVAGGAALVGLGVGVAAGWNARQRLQEVLRGTALLAAGDTSYRAAVSGTDELAELGTRFNELVVRLGDLVGQLQRLAAENDQLARQAPAAVAGERRRLAQELHDSVSQAVFAISLTAGTAARQVQQDPAAAVRAMTEVVALASGAQAEMRALLHELAPPALEDRPIAAALTEFLASVHERHQLVTQLVAADDLLLPPAVAAAAFRVVQEAVSNVSRHAGATRVAVHLTATPRTATLRVEDDGRGFEAARPGPGLGLVGMRQRVESLGGTFSVTTGPGRGTAILASFPLATGSRRPATPKEADGRT